MRRLEKYLSQINCLESTHRVPRWEARGIKHGFEGKGFELDASGHSLRQIHSAKIVESRGAIVPEEGDGLLTSEPGRLIAVKTADCVPVLIHHPRGALAIHAGWRGLGLGIVAEGLRLMAERSWVLREAEIAIGPCISLDSFEVGPEPIVALREGPFQMQDEEFAFASSKGRADRWQLDLGMLVAFQLARVAFPPEQITLFRGCTKKEGERWHSYRREGQAAGRNWSWIQM